METAPKVTPQQIEAAIVHETYTLLPNGRTTVCQLTLIDLGDSGFTVEGQSACVSVANYNEELGTKICVGRMREKVWMLLGFVLQWANIQGRPSSTVAEIDDAVAKKHAHANMSTLDKFSQDVDGQPTYDGKNLHVYLSSDQW